MKKQIFTQKQAQEMYDVLYQLYEDCVESSKKQRKENSILQTAYEHGISKLLDKIDKENINQKA